MVSASEHMNDDDSEAKRKQIMTQMTRQLQDTKTRMNVREKANQGQSGPSEESGCQSTTLGQHGWRSKPEV